MTIVLIAAICWLIIVVPYGWLIAIAATIGMLNKQLKLSRNQKLSIVAVFALISIRATQVQIAEPTAQQLTQGQKLLKPLLNGISPDAKALVAGLTYGDDSGLSQQLKSAMKSLSLTHLTAVSGANCAIVIALIFWVLGLMGFKRTAKFWLSLLAMVPYLWLVGFQPSVVRAATMAVIVLATYAFGRKLQPLNVLALTTIALLLGFTDLAFNYGFALSVLATFGIIWFAPLLYSKLKTRLPAWLSLSLAVVLAAQLFCLPVLAALQPEQSLLSVLANLLVEPVVAIITIIGILAATTTLIAPAIATALFYTASIFAQYIVAVATWLNNPHWPGIKLNSLTASLAVSACVLIVTHRVGKKLALVSVFATVTVISLDQWYISAPLKGFPIANWFYVSCDVGQGDATVIKDQDQIVVIDVGREPALIDQCLTQLNIKTIDLLVITHFDADHSAGLSGAIDGRQVKLAMLTDFADDRPGAYFSQQQLNQKKIKTIHAHRGMIGQLNNFKWQVLNPNPAGEDSDDPNDASITMLFSSQSLNIITMADLGEHGQMRISQNLSEWDAPELHQKPLILKVSHHGSADQYPELIEYLHPTIATLSVGAHNSYGHPTKRTLNLLQNNAQITLRTDTMGALSIAQDSQGQLLWQSAKTPQNPS